MLSAERIKPIEQKPSHLLRIFNQALIFENTQCGQAAGHRQVIAAKRTGMNYCSVQTAENLLVDCPPRHDRRTRDIPAAQAFCDGDYVRFKIPMLECPPFSSAPEPTLHLVTNHQCSILPTKSLCLLVKIIARIVDAFALYRFEQKRCHISILKMFLKRCQIAHFYPGSICEERPEPLLKIRAPRDRQRPVA